MNDGIAAFVGEETGSAGENDAATWAICPDWAWTEPDQSLHPASFMFRIWSPVDTP